MRYAAISTGRRGSGRPGQAAAGDRSGVGGRTGGRAGRPPCATGRGSARRPARASTTRTVCASLSCPIRPACDDHGRGVGATAPPRPPRRSARRWPSPARRWPPRPSPGPAARCPTAAAAPGRCRRAPPRLARPRRAPTARRRPPALSATCTLISTCGSSVTTAASSASGAPVCRHPGHQPQRR